MNYFTSAPLARDRMCAQTVGGETVERVHDFVVSGAVSGDEIFTFFGCHLVIPLLLHGRFEARIADSTDTLGLNREPILLYYPLEPSCANNPLWCLPTEPPVSFR